MKSLSNRKALFVIGAIITLLFAFGYISHSDSPADAGNVITLHPPSFVDTAHAEENEIASFIEDEAGITAYVQTANPINLATVRDAFRTIEYETAEYIIGSVELPDYPESHDVHVYVHADGWVVAYYLAADPTGKIIDLRHYDGVSITTTKLENAIAKILILMGVVSFDASYYDFRYPNATNLMLIAEYNEDNQNNTFEVQLPGNFTFYERSWSHAFYTSSSDKRAYLYLNGNLLSTLYGLNNWVFAQGPLTTAQLPPGLFHNFEITRVGGYIDACGLALTYQEGLQ